MERRLVAILAADVVGYSHLMEEDEAGTLAALKAHRDNFIDGQIAARHGRIVKLMGDGAPKEAVTRGYMAIFLVLTPDGAFLVTLLVLQSAQLGFAATFLPRE